MGWHKGKAIDRKRWRKVRLTIFERDGYRCRVCGNAGMLECDHIRPLHWGGSMWSPSNLQTICRGCHIRKTSTENQQVIKGRDEWSAYVTELEAKSV